MQKRDNENDEGVSRRGFVSASGKAVLAAAALSAAGKQGGVTMAAANEWTTTEPGAIFELGELLREREELGRLYHPFLRVPGLHMGIYHLKAGAEDPQSPHDEDEVYYVVSGKGRIRVEDATFDIGPNALVYVEARADHKFMDIEDDLTLLVFFASDKSAK